MGKAGKGKDAGGSCGVNKTPKWSVIDAPGVKQQAASSGGGAGNKEGLQGRRAKASSGPKIEAGGASIGGDSFTARTKNPEWLRQRETVYEAIKKRRDDELAAKTPSAISVTLPDGKVLTENKVGEKYMTWKTSPYDVACTISQGLADSATVARVTYADYASDYNPAEDGMEGEDMLMDAMQDGGAVEDGGPDAEKKGNVLLWDMTRPLVGNVSKMEFLKFDSDRDAKTVFWHSSAHMMGEALEHLFGCKLTIGPPLAGGFYYDSYMGAGNQQEVFREDDCTCSVSLRTSCHLASSKHFLLTKYDCCS